MKIAIIGIRGIPVTYSAFETFAEVLSTDFVAKDHIVTVYCRKGLVNKLHEYKGVTLVTLPHLDSKNLSTITHSLLSTFHACFINHVDIIFFLGMGSTIFSILPRMFGIKSVVHIDGMDWKREKWGWIGKSYLKFSAYLTTMLPNAVITDSKYMSSYYKQTYQKDIFYIPYGYFDTPTGINNEKIFKKYHVKRNEYFVWTGRLVPENYIEEFIAAFSQIKNERIRCLILGDDIYNNPYKEGIYTLGQKDKRVIFAGFIPHEEVLFLESHSLAYIETKRSGGTHVSLVEAMGVGALIISYKNSANKDVLGEGALFYDCARETTSLLTIMKNILKDPGVFMNKRKQIRSRAKKYYVWKTILQTYEKLFFQLVG